MRNKKNKNQVIALVCSSMLAHFPSHLALWYLSTYSCSHVQLCYILSSYPALGHGPIPACIGWEVRYTQTASPVFQGHPPPTQKKKRKKNSIFSEINKIISSIHKFCVFLCRNRSCQIVNETQSTQYIQFQPVCHHNLANDSLMGCCVHSCFLCRQMGQLTWQDGVVPIGDCPPKTDCSVYMCSCFIWV